MTKDGRIRLFEIVQFDEFWKPDTAINWLNRISCDFICVVHDKDKKPNGEDKAKHYHVVVRLKDARTIDDISKNCGVENQYVEIKNHFKDACAYLFHLTSNARMDHKYEYDGSAVVASKHISYEEIKSRSEDYDKTSKHDDEIRQLLFKYGNCEISKSDILESMTAQDYNKFGLMFRRMKEYRIMKVRNREMNVIYITGVSGSGKTTLAKYMAKVMNYDFFVSGSGKDVLDGYDKEECIILDDLRADAFTKSELFKLTDNNTNSSVKSRFQNKDISYCKLMIITSIKAPHDLYNWETDSFEDKDETFKQFSRRLGGSYVYIDDMGVIVEKQYFDDRITNKVLDFDMTSVFQVLGIEKKLGSGLMAQIYKKITDDCKQNKKKYEKDDDLPF